MKGNDRQIQAELIHEEAYQLSDDIPRVVIKPPPVMSGGLAVPIWEYLLSKYLNDARKRSTLGAIGVMAGYKVTHAELHS